MASLLYVSLYIMIHYSQNKNAMLILQASDTFIDCIFYSFVWSNMYSIFCKNKCMALYDIGNEFVVM